MIVIDYIPLFVFFIVFITIFYVIYHFWAYISLIKDAVAVDKFKVILTIISTIASVVFGSAVVLQVVNFARQQKVEEIDYYTKLSREFLDELLLIFLNNTDMSYYYDELFQINPITNKTKRNISKEHMISMIIFAKCAKFAIFELESTNEDAKIKVQKWLGHVFDTMMKSNILRNYWTTEYKPKLSGPATQKYMKIHYDL
jgi:hypothetical protein